MYGAYSTTRLLAVSRIFVRFIWFTFATIFICFLYVYVFFFVKLSFTYMTIFIFKIITRFSFLLSHFRKGLQDTTNSVSGSIVFKIYIIVLAIYAGIQLFWSSLARFPFCHHLFNRCDNSSVVRLIKWIHQVVILSSFPSVS